MSISPKSASRQNSLLVHHQDIAADLLAAAAQASAAQESSGESGAEGASPENDNDGAPKSEKRKKRSRACQACRNMKIRCNPVDGQEACLACSKVNRTCVMPGPARKRQKTVHRVADLEKKINTLQSLLLKNGQADLTPQQSPVVTDSSRSAREPPKDAPDERNFPLFPRAETPVTGLPQAMKSTTVNYEDVIDRGIISFATADRVFDKFFRDMNPLCPLIAFPPGTTARMIRRTRPMTFLAIIAAGSVALVPEVHSEATDELARQLADRIFFVFERSLDLIQAALIHTTWVGKHNHAREVGFNQYIHSAIVMAHDLGMTRRQKNPLTSDPVEEAELRRTLLACYWCGICVSTTLRHPPMIRNSVYVQDCITFFKNSPAALSSDRTLCALAQLVSIMEDVATTFHMDDPSSVIRIDDPSTQYYLKIFERRIEDWREEYRSNLQPGLLELVRATASLYTHEIAMHTDHNIDDFRPPSKQPNTKEELKGFKDTITPAHLDALTKCVVSMRSALDSFLHLFDVEAVRLLPCLSVVWTAYAVVAMIRLDGALRASNSRYAEIFLPDLKVDYYLDHLIDRLKRSSVGSSTYAPIPMFIHAFHKLKLWHQYRLAGRVPAEFAEVDMSDPRGGLGSVRESLSKMIDQEVDSCESTAAATTNTNLSAISSVENSMIGPTPAQLDTWQKYTAKAQQQTPRQQAGTEARMSAISSSTTGLQQPQMNAQGFDTQGGSWLSNHNGPSNMSIPIDASMFENQDWNFTLEDWNNFEASMVQPAGAGGTWLGYLL